MAAWGLGEGVPGGRGWQDRSFGRSSRPTIPPLLHALPRFSKTIRCHSLPYWSIIFVLAFSYVVEYSRCKIDSTSPRTDCADCIVMLWVLPLDSAQSADVFYPAECRATGLALFCIHLEEGGRWVGGGGRLVLLES